MGTSSKYDSIPGVFMAKSASQDLPVIQKTYDLIRWYVPILNRLPRNHRFTLGERMINRLYDLLEGFILARYSHHKLEQLEQLNVQIDLLRHQTRLLVDFDLMQTERYEYVSRLLNEIGVELGGWIRQQRRQVVA